MVSPRRVTDLENRRDGFFTSNPQGIKSQTLLKPSIPLGDVRNTLGAPKALLRNFNEAAKSEKDSVLKQLKPGPATVPTTKAEEEYDPVWDAPLAWEANVEGSRPSPRIHSSGGGTSYFVTFSVPPASGSLHFCYEYIDNFNDIIPLSLQLTDEMLERLALSCPGPRTGNPLNKYDSDDDISLQELDPEFSFDDDLQPIFSRDEDLPEVPSISDDEFSFVESYNMLCPVN